VRARTAATAGSAVVVTDEGRTVPEETFGRADDAGRAIAPEHFVLTLWTDEPWLAAAADAAGINRVGLDLERLGKAERQRGLGTWISTHRIEQLGALRRSLRRAELFARINPFGEHTAEEVERVLAGGVSVVMLPMFHSAEEVARVIALVAGRATVVPLLETRAAAEGIGELVAVAGLEEVHIGLNDLALSLGVRNRFEVLSSPLLRRVSEGVRAAGLRLGIGALGRVRDETVPVEPDLLYARYVELGATAALLARSFMRGLDGAQQISAEVAFSRERLTWWDAAGAIARARAHRRLQAAIASAPGW
jgi:2-keto-3-deoxy-L-rhamnonate aldolase RhmA